MWVHIFVMLCRWTLFFLFSYSSKILLLPFFLRICSFKLLFYFIILDKNCVLFHIPFLSGTSSFPLQPLRFMFSFLFFSFSSAIIVAIAASSSSTTASATTRYCWTTTTPTPFSSFSFSSSLSSPYLLLPFPFTSFFSSFPPNCTPTLFPSFPLLHIPVKDDVKLYAHYCLQKLSTLSWHWRLLEQRCETRWWQHRVSSVGEVLKPGTIIASLK